MARYFVSQTGSNTAPYDTWAKAATSLQTALTAANANGDVVIIDVANVPTVDKELTAATTYTFVANVTLFSATPVGSTDYNYARMDPAVSWIGNTTGSTRSITLSASDLSVAIQGLAFRYTGTSAGNFTVNANATVLLRDCVFDWRNNSSATTKFTATGYVVLQKCFMGFGNASQGFTGAGQLYVSDGLFVLPGNVPITTLFTSTTTAMVRGELTGCDLSSVAAAGLTLVGNIAGNSSVAFDRCTFPSGTVALAPQTSNPNGASPQVWVTNCNVPGGVVGLYIYASAYGQVSSETAVLLTGSPAGQSWRISTTSVASRNFPFYTSTINWFNTALGSLSPRIEVLRKDNTLAYSDSELWAVFSAITPDGSLAPPLSTAISDSATGDDYLDGTGAPQATGAGTSAWTNPGATAWSGKLDLPSPLDIVSAGPLRVRVAVSKPLVTELFINPVVLT